MSEGRSMVGGLEMIIAELDIRYEYDTNGRIAAARGEGILPRFVLGRAAEGCVWRFGATLKSEQVAAVSRLASREPGIPIAGEKPVSPPERLVMIERLLTSEGVEVETRFEILASGGVDVAELWTIHDSGELC